MFDTAVDIRLKHFNAQMDCDTALIRGRVEGIVSDLVRTERIIKQGIPLRYVAATNAYWLLISNRQLRMSNLKHLNDRMLAMTRYSVTDMLGDIAVDSAKLKPEQVFRIQVNDVGIRLGMLETGIMDAVLLPEPQATQARLGGHPVLMDTDSLGLHLGIIVFTEEAMADSMRQHQVEQLLAVYQQALDSIAHYGLPHYRDVIVRCCKVKPEVVDSIK